MRATVLAAMVGLTVACGPALTGQAAGPDTGASAELAARQEAGRRLFEEGLLPDGSALRWQLFPGGAAQAGGLTCAGCHGRSGYGQAEGSVSIPPVAAPVLFAPGPQRTDVGSPPAAIHRAQARSAYTEASLARALREGWDPDGRALRTPMPRFELSDAALQALVAHLRTLAAAPVPGWTPRGLVLAVVLTPGASASRQQALLQVLQAWVARRADRTLPWLLRTWRLQGASPDWPAQLAAFEAAEPPFALLSGAGGTDWGPVDQHCQTRRLPCVLPSLESAPDAAPGPYGLYFHGGLAADALAMGELAPTQSLLQWSDDQVDATAWSRLAPQSTLVLLLRDGPLQRLIEATAAAAAAGLGPQRVWLSASLADPAAIELPAGWRERVTWFGGLDPQAERRSWLKLRPWLRQVGLGTDELKTRGDAYAAAALLDGALRKLQLQQQQGRTGAMTRERLIEALEQLPLAERDDLSPYYVALRLGPGRHLAVAGSHAWRASRAPSTVQTPP